MQELIQFLLQCGQGIVTGVVGFLITRQLRIVFATAERTEQQAKATQAAVSQIDLISTSSWRTSVDQRIEALAEKRSDQLAWQAGVDGRLDDFDHDFDAIAQEWPVFRRFVLELDAYAHGKAPMPSLQPETRAVPTDPEGAST